MKPPINRPQQSIWLVVLILLSLFGCGENRVAGTSSGVDNPQLTLAFRDSTGMALRVTGDLNLYGQDQNPAVDPQALLTLKLKDRALANLSGNDIERITSAIAAKYGAGKVTASPLTDNSDTISDSIFHFNLHLKTDQKSGEFDFGLIYNAKTKVFSRSGITHLTRLEMRPRPLVRYQARVSHAGMIGEVSRVFIPGTPFQATLVDSVFFFLDLPPGVFPLRLLDGTGHIYTIAESLQTSKESIFITAPQPVGTLDSSHLAKLDSSLAIEAGPAREAFIEIPSVLEATLKNAYPDNARLSIRWRLVSSPRDSMGKQVLLSNPTSLRTSVKFSLEGVFQFEVSATLGIVTKKDTVLVSVRHIPPPPHPRIVQPRAGDSLKVGMPYEVLWEMPNLGPVTIRVSTDSGGTWETLVDNYTNPSGLAIFNWTPSLDSVSYPRCLLQVRQTADTLLSAESEGMFTLIP